MLEAENILGSQTVSINVLLKCLYLLYSELQKSCVTLVVLFFILFPQSEN